MSQGKYYLLQKANDDLDERVYYLLIHGSERIVYNFVEAVFVTSRLLASAPGIGQNCNLFKPHLRDLRRFPVRRFPHALLIYRPVSDGIEVARIVDSHQDWRRLLR